MSTNSTFAMYTAIGLLASASALAAASAQEPQSLLEVMQSCASQADDVARLRCYDRGVAPFKGVVDSGTSDAHCLNTRAADAPVSPKSTATAGSSAASSSESAPAEAVNLVDQFGLTSGQILQKRSAEERSHPLKQLTAHITSLSHRAGGHLVLHLDNEQVWEQSEDGPTLNIASGDAITIDRGALGAFWLSGASSRLAIKVRRLQ